MTTLENVLAALEIANKRIDELEKYNLDLASESFNKSNMIDYERGKNAELASQVEALRNIFPLKVLIGCDGHLNYPVSKYNDVVEAFNKTPAQCLLEVKAEAVHEFVNYVIDNALSNTLEAASFQFNFIKKGETK